MYPTDVNFATSEEAISACQRVANVNGFALSKLRSVTKSSTIYLVCDRHGEPRSSSNQQLRRTSSRKCGCQFRIWIYRFSADINWNVEVVKESHNHTASIDIHGHAIARRLNNKQKEVIQHMRTVNCPPRVILPIIHTLGDDGAAKALLRDVYNYNVASNKATFQGRSPLQTLIDDLHSNDAYRYHVKLDESGHVTHLYITEVVTMQMLKRFLEIILMDCIYKTNQYRLPLLDVVGINNLNGSFVIGMAFLSAETEDDY
jgi:hypothetical protein